VLGEKIDPLTWAVAIIVVALVLLGKREAGRGKG
jgi:hypothetical protein